MIDYINTEAGKYLLGQLTNGTLHKSKYPITSVTANSYHMPVGTQSGTVEYLAHFFCDNAVEKKIKPIFNNMQIANEYGYEAFLHHSYLQPNNNYSYVYNTLGTYTSNAAGDGAMRAHTGTNNITGLRSFTSATDLLGTHETASSPYAGTTDRVYLYRSYFPFDTSSIPDAAKINQTNTKLSVYLTSVTNSNGTSSAALIQTTQSDPTSLALGDFDNLTLNNPDEGATRLLYSTATASAYNDWPANSNLTSWISKTGYTKLGLRDTTFDIGNQDVGASVVVNLITTNSDSASNKPQLIVSYSLGGNLDLTSKYW